MTEIHILSATRTAIGGFGGALAAQPPIDIATHAARAALARAGVEGAQIGQVVMGHVINTEPRDMYLSRVMAMQAGIPETTPAMNVNRLCGSGAQAVVSAMQALMLGCLIPWFDGAILSQEWKEALWDRFVTAAPRPRTPSEQQYSDRKLRSRS